MQDAAADRKFVLSTLRDVALLTCRSRAAELARQTEEEERAFAAAVEQDQEELKAIEARIRDIRKETAAERRRLQDFQVRSACISFAHNPPPRAPWLRVAARGVLIPASPGRSPPHPRLSPGGALGQSKAMACARQYRDLHKRRLHPLLKGPAKAGDEVCSDESKV